MVQHQGNKNNAHWDEYSGNIISALNLKQIAKGEWHGACPSCGGKDRFWISNYNGEVKVQCRQCNDWKSIIENLRDQGLYPRFEKSEVTHIKKEIDWPEQIHPYLTKKRINQHNALISGDSLIIPIINSEGKKVGSQTIDGEGVKKFSKGMPIVGNFSVVGGTISDFTYVAEGWATACSVSEATSKPCVFALNANNLPSVVVSIMQAKPDAKIVICADNDDPGIKGAEACKADHGVNYLLPPKDMDFNDVWVRGGAEAVIDALTPKRYQDKVFWADDAEPILTNNYLIKNWLGSNQLSCLYGSSNTGKSFLALDMSWHIATGREWNGNRITQGVVLYLATEGGNSFRNRVFALKEHYGDENALLAVRPSPVDLFNTEVDLPTLEKLCDEIRDERGEIAMIVVDTLSRAMAGANENTSEDMSQFIKNCDLLRNLSGAHLMIVHHSGKDTSRGARGSSSLRGALDTEIELEVDEGSGIRTALSTKQRDLEGGAAFSFKLNVAILGTDPDGDDITTCVIEKADETELEDARKKQPKGKNQKLFIECFRQLRSDKVGTPNQGGTGWPEPHTYWVIPEDQIYEHFKGKFTGANSRTAWRQTIEALISHDFICMNLGQIWLLSKEGKV